MLQAHVLLAVLWILFGVLHSVFAGLGLKARVAMAFPKTFTYYRLLYTLFAFLTFGLVISYQAILQSPYLFARNLITTLLGGVISIAGLVLMATCIKKYFLSLSGLKSLFQERPTHQLMIGGIHRFVRHPLYLGTFLAIWGAFLVFPFVSLFISNLVITSYTLLGISFEEKKLVAEFGPAYEHYRKTVPMLLPAFSRKSN